MLDVLEIFIIGRTGYAVGQLILQLSGLIITCPMCCLACVCHKDMGAIFGIGLVGAICGLAALAGFIWCIIDGAHMIDGTLTDGNGFDLYHS